MADSWQHILDRRNSEIMFFSNKSLRSCSITFDLNSTNFSFLMISFILFALEHIGYDPAELTLSLESLMIYILFGNIQFTNLKVLIGTYVRMSLATLEVQRFYNDKLCTKEPVRFFNFSLNKYFFFRFHLFSCVKQIRHVYLNLLCFTYIIIP